MTDPTVKKMGIYLRQLRLKKDLTQQNVADQLGVKLQAVSAWERGENLPKPERLMQIAHIYDIPYDQLALIFFQTSPTQEGNAAPFPPLDAPEEVQPDLITYVPFVPVHATASFIENTNNDCTVSPSDMYPVLTSLLPNVRITPHHRIFQVRGESMTNTLNDGALVLAEMVNQGDFEYLNSGLYVVVFNDQLVVKRIKDNELLSKGYLTLHSDNPQHGLMPVRRADLRCIWRVVKILMQDPR